MIFKPAQLGMAKLDPQELEADKKACRKIGPCGVGKKALYLNSFYIDRRYYLPYGSITRVFKRVAMSSGGFSGKGVFASMAYLVVEYDGGKQKQCNFKDERDVDALLEVLAKEQPQLHLLSAAGEQALEKKAAEKAARKLPELSEDAQHSLTVLRRAKEYLDAKPELSAELSAAQRRKRAQLQASRCTAMWRWPSLCWALRLRPTVCIPCSATPAATACTLRCSALRPSSCFPATICCPPPTITTTPS